MGCAKGGLGGCVRGFRGFQRGSERVCERSDQSALESGVEWRVG